MSKRVRPYDAGVALIAGIKSKFEPSVIGKESADFLRREFDLFIADGLGNAGRVSTKTEDEIFTWKKGSVAEMRSWNEGLGRDDLMSGKAAYNLGLLIRRAQGKEFLMLGLFNSYLLDKQACQQIACENAPELGFLQRIGLAKKPDISKVARGGSVAVRSPMYSGEQVKLLTDEIGSLVTIEFNTLLASLPEVPTGRPGGGDQGRGGGSGGNGGGGTKVPAGVRPRVAVALDKTGREGDGVGRK